MILQSRPLDALTPGMTASQRRLPTTDDLYAFATATGNLNPLHLPHLDGDGDGMPEGMLSGGYLSALVSAALGTLLPGPGTQPVAHDYRFPGRAEAGEELMITVTVDAVTPSSTARMRVAVTRAADGAAILEGWAEVIPPARAAQVDAAHLPGLVVRRHRHFEAILARAHPLPPLVTVVVCPESPEALEGALLAMRHTLITPILIGHPDRILAAAQGADLSGLVIEPAATPQAAAARAMALVHEGRAMAVMKGHMHTDDLLRPMMDRITGLRRAGRRLTHVFVMDVPGLPHPLLVTDAAINIAPDLATKVDIVQNAIDLAISIGIELPRVGVLSAVETVTTAIPSSIDAALLSKMAERGQITGGLVDGPLAMDNAIDLAAARGKGLTSPVAGRAEVLVVPGIDAGNMLAKQLAYISHAEAAGVVMGATVPVILNSRSDGAMARLASCAVAALHHARTGG